MSLDDIKNIRLKADMIVCGYAFTKMENLNVQVFQLHTPHHALVLSPNSEVLETTMDDVELNIVKEYWAKNQKYLEETYA